jgi:hypothetical protein
MSYAQLRRPLEYLAVVALLLTFFGFLSVKIGDIDFWWHLAAGKEMVATGAVPDHDPFGVYDTASNSSGQTVLKSEWLGQVLLYSIYHFFGLGGIIFFRAATLTACLGIVYWRCRVAKVSLFPTMAMLTLAGFVILPYTGERPQLCSFLSLSLMFLLLDTCLCTSRRWPLYLVPPLFLLWANCHGGVMYGEVMLILFCAAYLLERRLINDGAHIQSGLILLIAGLSIAAFLTTPNGLTTLQFLALPENRLMRNRMSEYMTPWSLWPATIYYWAFFAVAVASLPGFLNKAYFKQGILVCAAALISLTAYRYIPLFVVLAAPYIAASLDRMLPRMRPPATAISLVVIVGALSFLLYGYRQNRVFQAGIMESRFPVAETALIKKAHLTGRIFNTINWGGYLIWNLSPEITVFLDGRALDPNRIEAYTHILWMTPDGRYLFDHANFDLVLIPPGNAFTGERYPLINYLLSSPNWRVAYQSRAGYLFVKARAF